MAKSKSSQRKPAAPPKARRPRSHNAAVRQAKRAADKGPERYRAESYHEIEVPGGGVLRVEPGNIVVTTDDGIQVMPPDRFHEAFPDVSEV